jgi:hypothetical protein
MKSNKKLKQIAILLGLMLMIKFTYSLEKENKKLATLNENEDRNENKIQNTINFKALIQVTKTNKSEKKNNNSNNNYHKLNLNTNTNANSNNKFNSNTETNTKIKVNMNTNTNANTNFNKNAITNKNTNENKVNTNEKANTNEEANIDAKVNTNEKVNTSTNSNLKTNSSTNTIAKGPSNDMLPSRNSLGHKVKRDNNLTSFPMKVKSCDQTAFFEAQYITDFRDFRLRKKGYFQINAHSASIFADKDSKQLIHHVLWGDVKRVPRHLKGGLGCIQIDSGAKIADISICFPSKSTAENLLKVIEDFYKCRMGDNLQPIPKKLFRKLLKVCGANGKILNSKGKKTKKFKMNLKPRAGNKWDKNRITYHQPKPIKVPGTIKKIINKKKKIINKK